MLYTVSGQQRCLPLMTYKFMETSILLRPRSKWPNFVIESFIMFIAVIWESDWDQNNAIFNKSWPCATITYRSWIRLNWPIPYHPFGPHEAQKLCMYYVCVCERTLRNTRITWMLNKIILIKSHGFNLLNYTIQNNCYIGV